MIERTKNEHNISAGSLNKKDYKLFSAATMTERVLRPKEKRKVSSLLSDSVVFAEDQEEVPTPSKRSKKGSTKENADGKKKKTSKKKSSSKNKDKGEAEFDFSKLESDEEGVLVIDDPDAYYQDDYNSEEERRKRHADKKEREEEQIKMEEVLKKKKKQRHASTTQKKYYQVPRDEHGNPIMPISLRGLTVYDLGKIVHDRPKFHAKRYLWPVGFKSSRIYSRYALTLICNSHSCLCSMTNLHGRCEYVSEIVDGQSEPRFVITCYEDPKNPTVIEASTPSGAWAQVCRTK